MRPLSLALAAATLAAAAPAPARAAFVDPLDQAAAPSPLAARRLLGAVALAGSRVVAAGQRGHILLSDDGGKSWTQAVVPVSSDLTALSFPTARRGWAVGHDGVVLTSEDGGHTWTRQLDGRRLSVLLAAAADDGHRPAAVKDQLAFLVQQGADLPLLDVWFDDERSGIAVGAFDLVLRTTDGGQTWTPWLDHVENPKALHLHAVRRAAGTLFIAGEQGLLLRLDPATQRFVPSAAPYAGSYFGLAGSDDAVLVFGLRGHVLRSADRGRSWQEVTTGVESAITGGARAADGRLVLVSSGGRLLVSGDDGRTFSALATERPLPTSAVAAAGAGLVLVGPLGARVEPLR
ncbi:MAG TPA: YCF48-related protein [Anaeromyxobacteraceae bacterium]|nr:YCF48-related protein [Anaeromyxobacteraceae bacterium]